MPGTASRKVVVFDRIEANRRNTRLMLGIFGLALLPVVGLLSSYLPIWFVMFLPGLMDFMKEARKALAVYLVLAGAIAPVLLWVALYVQYRYADRLALRMAKARPLERDRERGLWDTIEDSPSVPDYLSRSCTLSRRTFQTPFPWAWIRAFLDCRHPGAAVVATPREREGVLAHEISHIGNQDIRLNTTVAAMGAVLRLPFRLLTAPIRFLFHVHWLLGSAALLLFFRMLLLLSGITISGTSMNSTRAACFERSHWFKSV